MRVSSRPLGPVSIALACALASALAACGGSSYKGLSKADFVTRADAICKADNAKFADAAKGIGDNPTLAQVKSLFSDQLLPMFRSEVSELRALKPPKADRAAVKKLLDEVATGADQIESATKKATTLKELQDLTPPALDQANKDAKAYGLKVCGES